MRRICLVMIAILFGAGTAAESADAGQAEAWAALRAGRHVALMRHADAPGGFGDPPGFRVDARLRAEGIAAEQILASPWCRCVDTATLLQLGPVETAPTFGNVVVLRDQRDSLTSGTRTVIEKWTGSGTLFVVTHGANIQALTGIQPASGEIVVRGGGREAVGRLILE